MPSPAEHYKMAEKLMEAAQLAADDQFPTKAMFKAALAQVHATLALAEKPEAEKPTENPACSTRRQIVPSSAELLALLRVALNR